MSLQSQSRKPCFNLIDHSHIFGSAHTYHVLTSCISPDASFVLSGVTCSPRGLVGPYANFCHLKVFNIAEEI